MNKEIPQLVAHRGYMEKYPENSWMSIKAAMDAGACWVEFDVQMCGDGEFILMHDATLQRVANSKKSVFEIASNEFKNISVHEPDRFGNKYHPLPVITLDTILIKLSKYSQIKAMIEIKEESLDHWGVDKVMDKLLEKLTPHNDHCVLISFNYDALEYARNKSNISIGWVLHRYDQEHKIKAHSLAPNYLICNHNKLPKHTAPWSGPWKWMLYDITSQQAALNWAAMGVQLIETADIGSMLRDSTLLGNACYHGV